MRIVDILYSKSIVSVMTLNNEKNGDIYFSDVISKRHTHGHGLITKYLTVDRTYTIRWGQQVLKLLLNRIPHEAINYNEKVSDFNLHSVQVNQ